MAKKEITTVFKIQAPGGQATPAPPIGPALGQNGVNPGQFITKFNDATRDCPKCGATLHDDVDLCWKCGHALMARHQRRASAFHARQRVARRISQNNACSASAAINADDERCWVKRSGTHERFPCSVRGAVGAA